MFLTFIGSSCPQQVLHLHLPLHTCELVELQMLALSHEATSPLFPLQSLSSHLQNGVGDTIHLISI